MQEKRFLRLYRSLRRMNHVEAKRRDLLEAGGDPNEGVVNGVLYRKVKRSVIDNINATPDGTSGDAVTNEPQQEAIINRLQQTNNDEAGQQDDDEEERFWVDRYGWPLEEDVYMGTDIVGEWDAWRDEHQRREDQLESARRAAAAATSSASSSTSTSTSTAESASAIFAPRHFGNGHRRGSVRGENGFGGGWNDDHCGGPSSVSFDNISDGDSDDDDDDNDDHGRRARLGARSLSLDAVGCASARGGGGGGGVDSGDEGHTYARSDSSRPRFMSRHAAKMRKRYPMLAEYAPRTLHAHTTRPER
jgi:hypothetical protein